MELKGVTMRDLNEIVPEITIGLDLGDRYSFFSIIERGEDTFREQGHVRTTPTALEAKFRSFKGARIAVETGTHSPWVSRLLEKLGLEVYVANARKLRQIYENPTKSDRIDSEELALTAQLSPRKLHPIKHRGEEAQRHRCALRSRETLVSARTSLINHVRAIVKTFGYRLTGCGVKAFHKKALEQIPEDLLPGLRPVVETIGQLTEKIRLYDKSIEKTCECVYPETARGLRQVRGVGPLTALAFLLVIEDPKRFPRRRSLGSYVGLTPKRDQSGAGDPQLRISKAGDKHLRGLLVNCAQYILGPFGEDSDLRRFGERMMARGGKNARKRAVVAVARKLAILLHSLWSSGETYEPLRNSEPRGKKIPA